MLLYLLIACSSDPSVYVPVATHAWTLQTAHAQDADGLALLQLGPTGWTWRSEPVSVDSFAQRLSDDPLGDLVLVAVDPSVPWQQTSTALSALAHHTRTAALVVSDPTGEPRIAPRDGPMIEATWIQDVFSVRSGADNALVTGPEARLLGVAGRAAAVTVSAGPLRPTGQLIGVLNALRGQGVPCLATGLSSRDTGSAQAPIAAFATISDTVTAIPVALQDGADGCSLVSAPTLPMSDAPVLEPGIVDSTGALSHLQLSGPLSLAMPQLQACVDLPQTGDSPDIRALARVDISANGSVLGTQILAPAATGALRVEREDCVAHVLHNLTFPAAATPSRLNLAVGR